MRFLNLLALLDPKGNLSDDVEVASIRADEIVRISGLKASTVHARMFREPMPKDHEDDGWAALVLRDGKTLYVRHDPEDILRALAVLNENPKRTTVMVDDTSDTCLDTGKPFIG